MDSVQEAMTKIENPEQSAAKAKRSTRRVLFGPSARCVKYSRENSMTSFGLREWKGCKMLMLNDDRKQGNRTQRKINKESLLIHGEAPVSDDLLAVRLENGGKRVGHDELLTVRRPFQGRKIRQVELDRSI